MKSRFYKTVKVIGSLGVWALVLLGVAPQTQAVDVSFAPAVDFRAGSGARSVTIVDLNNDGNPDMVLADSYDSTVTVYLGDGSGGFVTATTLSLGVDKFPMKVASADLNEDGKADLVTANYISGDVSVLLGNGDGTFQNALVIPTAPGPHFVAIDDLNKDGHMDLVVANYEAFTVSVLLGDGLGGLGDPADYSVFGPSAVAIGDLDKDGNKDLVVVDPSNSIIYALFGDGLGGFGAASPIFSGSSHPRSVAVADLNADSNPDIAVASYGDNKVYVLMGNGDGTFQGAVSYPVGVGPHDVVVGDLNGDGKPDMAIANSSAYSVSVLLNGGLGGFGTAADFPVGFLPLSLALGDLNKDCKLDLVTADFDCNYYPPDPKCYSHASVLLNTTDIEFNLAVSKQGTGNGTVTSDPAGIDCGATCTAAYDICTSVTLSAMSDAYSTFVGWSGACSGSGPCVVKMSEAKSVTAMFESTIVDTTPPQVTITATPNILWPPNHKLMNVVISGSAQDSGSGIASVVITVEDEYGIYNMTVPSFGSTIQLEAWRNGLDKDGRRYKITAVARDNAGNQSTAVTEVVVPHDRGK